ncbi:MAG: DUF3108 domain-containing protein [Thermodesulfobacteriota bacterium]
MKSFSFSDKNALAAAFNCRPLWRGFKLIAFFFFSFSTIIFSPPVFAGVAAKPPTIGMTFVGEKLRYDIGFWLFEKVATAELTLEKEAGGYRAVLKARTTGFVDKMIQHREDKYVAHLKESPGGGRFITTSFESTSNVNGKVRQSRKEIIRLRGVLKKHSWGGGKDERRGEVRLLPNSYVDDPLGAFYNFRYGVYGPVRVGAKLRINTFPKEDYKSEKMTMIFRRGEKMNEQEAKMQGYGDINAPTYVARVKMSKDVFGSDLTDIEIFFSTALIPLRATARDVAFFTDVRGTLVSVSRGRK